MQLEVWEYIESFGVNPIYFITIIVLLILMTSVSDIINYKKLGPFEKAITRSQVMGAVFFVILSFIQFFYGLI